MKKLTIISVVAALILSVMPMSVYAYRFPEPDWGALLKHRENMVNETEFELYAEADKSTAPYYGSRLEPGAGTYIGMITENSKPFQPVGSYLTYIDASWENDFYYPANQMIQNDNVMVTVGWNFNSVDEINYNSARETLNNIQKYNKPVYVRIAAEMNCSSLGDEPDRYIEAFRNLANMVHEYPNYAVVWSPVDLGALDRPFEYYYPGDEYVDWVGVSCYSIRYFQGNMNTQYKDSVYFMTGDYAWATNRIKPVMEFMKNYNINKPVMISEGGVTTSSSYGEDYSVWGAPRMRNMLWYLPMKYPQIKLINYFNTHRENEIEKFDISDYPYAADIFKEAAASGAYIRQAGASPEFVFQPAYWAGALNAENNIIRLYTLAYIPGVNETNVNYSIDGIWKHSSGQIPYTYYMDVSGIADGVHTLQINAEGLSKEYRFVKSGQSVVFNENATSDMLGSEVADTDNNIRVLLNGGYIDFDQPPVIQDGRTLVPLRAIFEALGATVEWNAQTKQVTAVRGSDSLSLTIGSNVMTKNGKSITLDVAAQIINERTLVPARAIAESFGAAVDWDAQNRTVIVSMN